VFFVAVMQQSSHAEEDHPCKFKSEAVITKDFVLSHFTGG
jgi:hypothetical protein